ncbi:mRNA decay protein [Massospora cicadina]|nr:mRNA decay protein [Massospora cicadina]
MSQVPELQSSGEQNLDPSAKDIVSAPHDPEAHRLWRSELIRPNLQAWKTPLTEGANLDSNIKKNTAFIKKCRVSLNATSAPGMVREVGQLKLEKYVSEVVAALSEGILKCRSSPNVTAAVEVISALHQRFPDSFTPELFEALRKMLLPPGKAANPAERDEASRLLRQRIVLRVTTEVWLVGVFWGIENGLTSQRPGAEAQLDALLTNLRDQAEWPTSTSATLKNNRLGLVYHSVKDLLPSDKERFANASLAVSFLKTFGEDLLDEPKSGASLVTDEHRQAFHSLFHAYAADLLQALVKEHRSLQREDKLNQERYIARGEIHEDTRARYEAHFKAYEKHSQLAQSIAECLRMDMPDLPKDNEDASAHVVVNDATAGQADDDDGFENSPWEDEDARTFYEKVLDLKTLVPSTFLGSGKDTHNDAELKEELHLDQTDLEPADLDDSDTEVGDFAQEDPAPMEGEGPSLSGSAQMNLFVAKLLNMANRDLVDQAAVDFCYISNKASCNRLTQNLIGVPAHRLDLLSHYSRLIATLHPYFPDISQGVQLALSKEFRSLVRRKAAHGGHASLQERRIRNARYLGELTKFRLIPTHFVLFMIKTLLDHFSLPGNIETLCAYLEVCGRFLAKSPDTCQKTEALLEVMMRKRAALHLDDRLELLIDNAFYQCYPPSQSALVRKERSPMVRFIRNLLLLELNKRPLEKTLQLMRKLHWDAEAYRALRSIFSKVHKSRFANLPALATLLSGLVRYHPDFVVDIVDQVIEDIHVGLEENNYRDCQKRIAQAKYLAELYNYRVVDSPVIFDTLYRILTLGYDRGRVTPGASNPLDPPTDFFRVRLCCTILDACGVCFDRGPNRLRLDDFLTHFQLYILSKPSLPMDIQFAFNDTVELLRPNLTLFTSYQEAESALIKSGARAALGLDPHTREPGSFQSGSDSARSDEEVAVLPESASVASCEVDDPVILLNPKKGDDLEQRQREEEEFEVEYQLMMASALESRRIERKQAVFDVPIPIKLLDKNTLPAEDADKVAFTLLTKRGNKQQAKTMAIPSDSNLVINTLNKQRAERVEQQQLKEIVLSLEENLDHEAEREFGQDLTKPGARAVHPRTRPNSKPTKAKVPDPGALRASDFGLKSRATCAPVRSCATRPPISGEPLSDPSLEISAEAFPPLSSSPQPPRGKGQDVGKKFACKPT